MGKATCNVRSLFEHCDDDKREKSLMICVTRQHFNANQRLADTLKGINAQGAIRSEK